MFINVFLLVVSLSFQRRKIFWDCCMEWNGMEPSLARHIDIKATDMSVKRSDIKYTGIAFIKYQLWFYPPKRSMNVNETSF